MKCEDFGRYIDNYESLTDAEKTEMTDHAEMCEKCREELDFFLAMLSATKSLPSIEPPADFMATLNERLDAEDKKPSPNKIIYHVRRNWKQYTSLAACLALVAVITANRGILLDRIEGNEDGVITEETVSEGDNTAPNGVTATAAPETAAAEALTGKTTEAAPETAIEASAPARTSAPSGTASEFTGRVRTVNTSSASSVYVPESSAKQAAAVSAQTAAEEPAAAADSAAIASEPNRSGDYGIALKGVVMSATETASVDYDLKPEEVSASLRASKIIDSYSLADGSESIAFGAYYSIDKNGKPIMTVDENAIKAVGSLKIAADDAEKAMEILSQYPHDESGNVYTMGSENVDEILSELSEEDVTYTNYIVGGSDDVKFRIEFN